MPAFALATPRGCRREHRAASTVRGELIALYSEAFDRGPALVQLAFLAERIRRILEKAAAAQNGRPDARVHLDRISSG